MKEFLKINEKDNVIVVLKDFFPGETITVEVDGKPTSIEVLEDVPAGHKMAIKDIPQGAEIVKYGYRIGYAKETIVAGHWAHTHNIKTALGEILNYNYEPVKTPTMKSEEVTFMGYNRPDGKVGVRNDIWIIPTVGCVANVATAIAKESNRRLGLMDESIRESVGEVIAFPHPYGCSQMGDDQENTRTILSDLITHPNAGAVLVLGLGCENSNIEVLKPYIGEVDERRVKFLVSQEVDDELGLAPICVTS